MEREEGASLYPGEQRNVLMIPMNEGSQWPFLNEKFTFGCLFRVKSNLEFLSRSVSIFVNATQPGPAGTRLHHAAAPAPKAEQPDRVCRKTGFRLQTQQIFSGSIFPIFNNSSHFRGYQAPKSDQRYVGIRTPSTRPKSPLEKVSLKTTTTPPPAR